MGVTYPPAPSSIQKLIEAKVLTDVKPRTMPARFIAKGILDACDPSPGVSRNPAAAYEDLLRL